MMTVRYPNGQAIVYNTGWYLVTESNVTMEIFDKPPKDGGSLIAKIQPTAGVIVEWVQACRVYDATKGSFDQKLADIEKELRSIKRRIAQSPSSKTSKENKK